MRDAAGLRRPMTPKWLGRALAGTLLALALGMPPASVAAEIDTAGLLWLPDQAAQPQSPAVVIALHDTLGIDPRGWHYGDQLTAAGITVLHVELLELSADGYGMSDELDEAAAARERLTKIIELLAEDPRFADASIGLLAFGEIGQAALRAAADPVLGPRIAGLALLYPGCAALAAEAGAEARLGHTPVLLLHGHEDPANTPAACTELATLLRRTAPVRRVEYAGAGYAWDRAPHGPHEVVKLPWPGRPGALVAVRHRPDVAELAATQVAAFFAARFARHAP